MKWLYRLSVILGISFLGELMHLWIPLPIPASIYGLILMFAGLYTRVIPLEAVRGTGRFLIEIMPVMFIPAGVGLMNSWGALRPVVVPVSVIVVVSTFAVMDASGLTAQAVIRRERREKEVEK